MRRIEIVSQRRVLTSMPKAATARRGRKLFGRPIKEYNDRMFEILKDYLQHEFNGRLYDRQRTRENISVRRWACYIMTDIWGWTLHSVGHKLEIDHATVMHHRNTIRNWMRLYPKTEEQRKRILFYLEN